ncbi:unnamed protein product [Vitrella brassicaformis CCMP3155]|uniref:Transmembrane protein n=1 Tax=Vitrella brassicaformis (strain CCMP3155) TaxID=1169540 RepID=A0A0G4F3L6_VITBC|nr:unnamed protein product [Vitrella brassicaformis CCMP3155]|eukprot:CEM06507.1 unnamed protein product [Vitrella brassicaformis CCMP3155]
MADLSDAEKKFLAFDFSKSSEWQSYLGSLYPTPPHDKILKWKKKWYQKNVDKDFPLDSSAGEPARDKPSSAGPSGASYTQSSPNRSTAGRSSSGGVHRPMSNAESISVTAQLVAIVCAIIYLIPMLGVARRAYTFSLGAFGIGFFADVVSKCGMPKFSTEYLQRAVQEDVFFMIIYCMFFLTSPPFVVLLVPPAMTAFMAIVEFSEVRAGPMKQIVVQKMPSMAASFDQVTTFARNMGRQRYQIMGWRADCEVGIGFLLILLAFGRRMSPLTVFIYWSTMRLRYMMSAFTQASFRKLDTSITRLLAAPMVPSAVMTIYQKIRSYCYSFVDEDQLRQQQAGGGGAGRMCTIM